MTAQPSKYVRDHIPFSPAPLAILSHHHLITSHPALVLAWPSPPQSRCNQCDLKLMLNLVHFLLKTFHLLFISIRIYPKGLIIALKAKYIWPCYLSDLISFHFLSPSFLAVLQTDQGTPPPSELLCAFPSVQRTSDLLLHRSLLKPYILRGVPHILLNYCIWHHPIDFLESAHHKQYLLYLFPCS